MKKLQRRKLIVALTGILACPLMVNAAQTQSGADYFAASNQFAEQQNPLVAQQPIFSTMPVDRLSRQQYSDVLGWVPSSDNICRGYYREPAILLKFPNPGDINTQATTVTASLPSLFSQRGTSVLRGNVTVTQPGREVIADKAYVNRDPVTGKISSIDMIGNVHMREAGKLVVAQQVHIDLENNTANIENAVYRFSKQLEKDALNAWGTLRHGTRETDGVMNLHYATYSTCPPTTETWQVRARHLRLDKEKGEGVATNTFLDVENFPVFYLPYLNFPLDDRRKSGFLFPTYGFSVNSGANISVPYYFNLAPNYDMTLTPNIFSKRGLQQNINFRYLTSISSGILNFGILPYDPAFASFKRTAPSAYSNIPNEDVYLRELDNSSNTRGYFSYQDTSTFNPNWNAALNLNYVTDDYYFQDFGSTPSLATTNQLLNEGDLNYQSDHWRFLGRLQGFETLHPITQMLVDDQYYRLPEFDLSADYPQQAYGLDYSLNSQFVYFDQANDFITGNPVVTGDRIHAEPGISWPIANMNGYFTPQLQFDGTDYDLKNQVTGLPSDISRGLPVFDINTGLYFDRDMTFFSKPYRQTLEPELFYLYVPTTNQNDIPTFDTTLPPFSFEQMFQTNRFTGLDRIGDANQLTFALTSRFLDDYNGQEKLRASIGSMYLFQQHHVFCSGPSCLPDPTVNDRISPVVGELSYNLSPVWNLTGDLAWDPNRAETNNGNVNLIYNYGSRIFNVGYYFVRDADIENQVAPIVSGAPTPIVTDETDLNRINVGAAWPISKSWSVLADWNYNISGNYPQVYFYGAQYDSCCWAMRFVVGRNLFSIDQNTEPHFNTTYYVQFQLKGLGNFGYNNPGSLLTSALPGYQDAFQTGFRPLS